MVYSNAVYINKNNNNEVIRIIEVDVENDICFYYPLNSTLPNCEKYKLSSLENEISLGLYIKISDPFSKAIDEESISLENIKKRDLNWSIIQNAWSKYKFDIIEKNSKRNIFKLIAEENFISERTARRLFSRFFRYGMTKMSMLPNYRNCGGKGKDRVLGDDKVGRPSKYGDKNNSGINVTEDIKNIFRICIEKYYYNEKQESLTEVYNKMLREFFSYKYKDSNGKLNYTLYDKIPKYPQFYYWKRRFEDTTNEIISRQGIKEYDLKDRPLLNNSTMETVGPGTRFQVDATIADIYLISKFDRERIIGRPIVYAIIDVFSRLVTGIYVGFEGPSWIGAMMALDNMVTDKVEYCKRFDIDIEESEWPAHHLPQIIIADRGEFEGYSVENLINNLGVSIENTPPYRGDLKGIVERRFRTINTKIKHKTPGAIMKEYRQRGDRDYRLDAQLTLDEFTKIIIKLVLSHNNTIIQKYPIEKEMISDGVAPIPTKLWYWGIKNKKGGLRVIDGEIMKLNVMPKAKASVSRSGIRFKGLFYSSQKAVKEQWFVKNKIRSINIVYDPRNVNYIYIPDSDGRSYEKCFLLDTCIQYKDAILYEVVYFQELHQELLKEKEQENLQKLSNLDKDIEDIVKQAQKEGKSNIALMDLSNTQKIKNIRNNRHIEKELNREFEKFELDKTKEKHVDNEADGSKINNISNIDSLYEKIRQKGYEKFDGHK
ncbi:Mu transposase C-terminal domain-containing protein [Sedimentibacter sp. B4]|uniref:Mu transposase C-terminal domain-containing protein n=1 Tax=Sedimentibacter sp. B4 TaxID=304766 RepID=UPI0002E767D9|nr:Mu transposase C-terminal domain-containing protein [Sedimentibacter sp. B4]